MATKTILQSGDHLTVADRLVSSNGFFVARVEMDGAVRVYHGTPAAIEGSAIWASGATRAPDVYVAVMQTDGNFAVYRGARPSDGGEGIWDAADGNRIYPTAPGDYFLRLEDDGALYIFRGKTYETRTSRGPIWVSGPRDAAVAFEAEGDLAYRTSESSLTFEASTDAYTQLLSNPTDQPQTSTVHGSLTVEQSTHWSHTDSVTDGVEVSVEFTVPVIDVVSGSVSYSHSRTTNDEKGGGSSSSRTVQFDTTVTAPPGRSTRATTYVRMGVLRVPYTWSGYVSFASGLRHHFTDAPGVFVGQQAMDVAVEYADVQPHPDELPGSPAPAPTPAPAAPAPAPAPAPARPRVRGR